MRREVVRFENVTVMEDGEVSLDNLSFYVTDREIVGFLLTNDKGEKEILELLRRNSPIDFGRIFWEGKQVNSYLNSDYTANKVYVIDQKSSLIDSLSIADNIFVLRGGFKKYIINESVLREQTLLLMKKLDMHVDIDQRVSRLSVLDRIKVEVIKACLMGCPLMIFLYPDKIISQMEYEEFHSLLRKVKDLGIAVLYFCYHHRNLFQICDRIVLFSSGRVRKVFRKDYFTEEYLAPYIMTFDSDKKDPEDKVKREKQKMFEIRRLCTASLDHLNIVAEKGECVTLLDADNQVADELIDILSGKNTGYEGSIVCDNMRWKEMRKDIVDYRIILLDDNPTGSFLFYSMTYFENMCFFLDRKIRKSRIKKSYLRSIRNEFYKGTGEVIDEKNINTLSLQQKYGLVYNKLELFHPKLLIVRKPFAYGDMHCRKYILERLKKLKASGTCILLITNNITDCQYLSDRIEIVKEGRNIVTLTPEEYKWINETIN